MCQQRDVSRSFFRGFHAPALRELHVVFASCKFHSQTAMQEVCPHLRGLLDLLPAMPRLVDMRLTIDVGRFHDERVIQRELEAAHIVPALRSACARRVPPLQRAEILRRHSYGFKVDLLKEK